MRKAPLFFAVFIAVSVIFFTACKGPEPALSPATTLPLITETGPNLAHSPEPAPIPTPTPTPTPTPSPAPAPTTTLTPKPAPTPSPERLSMKILDEVYDWKDKYGNPIDDEPYMDIVEAEIIDDGIDYLVIFTLAGLIPEKTPDPEIFIEWDLYIDADCDPLTGSIWQQVTGNLGSEYLVRLFALDELFISEAHELDAEDRYVFLEYSIMDNVITLHVPKFSRTGAFNFVVATKKFGEEGDADAFLLFDKAPNNGYSRFPSDLDEDKDGFTDYEEVVILATDPLNAEEWDDLNTVTSLLDTPRKVCLFLENYFVSSSSPSQLFAIPVAQTFEAMRGDCDEYSMLALYWLTEHDYEAYLLDVVLDKWWDEYNTWQTHDICVYRDGEDQWYTIDIYHHGTGLSPRGPYQSVDEICNNLRSRYDAPDWKEYSLYDIDGNPVETVIK